MDTFGRFQATICEEIVTKTCIGLVTLGNLKFPFSTSEIEKWKSDLFAVEHMSDIRILPNSEGKDWRYTDEQLCALVTKVERTDFTVGIINAPLEHNFYLRRLGNNVCVISLYEVGEILHASEIRAEQFILRCMYELTSAYLEHKQIPDSAYSLAHDETRSCIFDMCANKYDIVFSTSRPTLCDACKARISAKQVAKGYFSTLEKELGRIRKPLFYRASDFVKTHPIYSLAITAVVALFLNVVANAIYDAWIKRLLGLASS